MAPVKHKIVSGSTGPGPGIITKLQPDKQTVCWHVISVQNKLYVSGAQPAAVHMVRDLIYDKFYPNTFPFLVVINIIL